jgi:hypothetical protein
MFEEQWYHDDSRKQKHFTIIQATSAIELSMTTTVCNVFLQSPYKQGCVFIAFLFFGGFRGSVKPLEISFSTKKQLDAAPTGFPDPPPDLPPRTNPTPFWILITLILILEFSIEDTTIFIRVQQVVCAGS